MLVLGMIFLSIYSICIYLFLKKISVAVAWFALSSSPAPRVIGNVNCDSALAQLSMPTEFQIKLLFSFAPLFQFLSFSARAEGRTFTVSWDTFILLAILGSGKE
jgi:hypothetical protein